MIQMGYLHSYQQCGDNFFLTKCRRIDQKTKIIIIFAREKRMQKKQSNAFGPY